MKTLREFQEEVEQVLDQEYGKTPAGKSEKQGTYTIELPGVLPSDISVKYLPEGNRIRVSAEGIFLREIRLRDACNPNKITAKLLRGVLYINVSQPEEETEIPVVEVFNG